VRGGGWVGGVVGDDEGGFNFQLFIQRSHAVASLQERVIPNSEWTEWGGGRSRKCVALGGLC
jgi:hypothetical protein